MEVQKEGELVRITCPACKRTEHVPLADVVRVFKRNVDVAAKLASGPTCECQIEQNYPQTAEKVVPIADFRSSPG